MRIKTFLLMVLFAIVPNLLYAAVNDNEELMIEPVGGNRIEQFVTPEAVYFNQTINLVYANPEQATVSVYTEQGILIDLTSVKSISTLPAGVAVHIIYKCSQRQHPIKAYSTTFPTTNEHKVINPSNI